MWQISVKQTNKPKKTFAPLYSHTKLDREHKHLNFVKPKLNFWFKIAKFKI